MDRRRAWTRKSACRAVASWAWRPSSDQVVPWMSAQTVPHRSKKSKPTAPVWMVCSLGAFRRRSWGGRRESTWAQASRYISRRIRSRSVCRSRSPPLRQCSSRERTSLIRLYSLSFWATASS